MAAFTLYDGDYGEYKVSVLANLQKDRLIDLQMYLDKSPGNLDDSEEYILCYDYKDTVLLRDYLTSVINLFEKTRNDNSESDEES